jgi:hypothetical protein
MFAWKGRIGPVRFIIDRIIACLFPFTTARRRVIVLVIVYSSIRAKA